MDLHLSPGTGSVAVETIVLGVHAGHLTYRLDRQDLPDDEHPDATARRLARFSTSVSTGFSTGVGQMLHSTSWRFSSGRIVLTYAALPDPMAATATVLGPPAAPAIGADPLNPSPPAVGPGDVVAHACRHLTFLRRTDPVVAAASRHHPGLWALLDAYQPDVAGQRV